MKITFKNESPKVKLFEQLGIGDVFSLEGQNVIYLKFSLTSAPNSITLGLDNSRKTYSDNVRVILRDVELIVND